ncbi:retrovirus-related Pol polyprotein from type-2 retrotransposable element R2DM, partial [Nephila pilipes]
VDEPPEGSPPTGPPPISPFKKDLYSRVVKKGLYRCQFCEKSFITEEGANRHKTSIHGISPHKTVASLFPNCSPELCRVCCKGPAPYSSLADHYKFIHNLSIDAPIQPDSIATIEVPAKDFVSTQIKHVRNFIIHKSSSTASKPIHSNSQLPKNTTISKNNTQTRVYNNLKIVARPELRGTGPAKIVAMPSSKYNSPTSSPSTIPPIISVKAEIHQIPNSLANNRSSPSLKCTLCSFIAVKSVGLRLHYYQVHGLRKIPTSYKSIDTIIKTSSANSQSHPAASSRTKYPNTFLDPLVIYPSSKNNSPPPISSIDEAIPSKSASSKTFKPSTTGLTPKQEIVSAKQLSHPPTSSSTKVFHSNLLSFKNKNFNKAPSNSVTKNHANRTIPPSSMEQFTSSIFAVPPNKNAVASQHPVVASQPPSPIVPFVSFNSSTLQYSFPIPTRLQCPIVGCNASFGTKSWYTTNTSIKKHLHIFHKQKPSKINYHCSVCNSSIAKNPAKHSCLINNLILHPAVIEGDHWVCEICECFSATTKIAKKNHLDAHAREVIKANSSQLIIPPNSKAKRKSFNKRIKDLSEGPAGNLPLAPPIADAIESENPPVIEIENITKIDLDNVSILASFAEPLDAILEVDDIEEAQVAFETLLDDIISIMQNHFHLAPSNESKKAPPSISSTRVKSDPQNAQLIQRQYRWNRRKCVRNIVNPSSSFCQIEKNLLHSHFTESWAPPSVQHTFPDCSPPTLPPVLELLHSDAIASCLQSFENSAPGPDRLSYQHWKSIDPRCIIISKIFNICIKFKDVPSSWKHSTCILIPKKGDVSSILNWRPITLSNSIYKLFSKCLARRLQDWCGMHDIISPCQKGFTPFDGVVEHNFVIGQHLEAARRSHTESFLVWLDISNAFGSIPHNILFSAMSSVGIDQDFIHLIQKLYSNSSTKIITNQG